MLIITCVVAISNHINVMELVEKGLYYTHQFNLYLLLFLWSFKFIELDVCKTPLQLGSS